MEREVDTEFFANEAVSLEKMSGVLLMYDHKKWAITGIGRTDGGFLLYRNQRERYAKGSFHTVGSTLYAIDNDSPAKGHHCCFKFSAAKLQDFALSTVHSFALAYGNPLQLSSRTSGPESTTIAHPAQEAAAA